jgi:hypothetical protein
VSKQKSFKKEQSKKLNRKVQLVFSLKQNVKGRGPVEEQQTNGVRERG